MAAGNLQNRLVQPRPWRVYWRLVLLISSLCCSSSISLPVLEAPLKFRQYDELNKNNPYSRVVLFHKLRLLKSFYTAPADCHELDQAPLLREKGNSWWSYLSQQFARLLATHVLFYQTQQIKALLYMCL
jgi:hypothetical protein